MRFAQQWHSELGCSGLQLQLSSQPRRKDILAKLIWGQERGQFECGGSSEGSLTRLSFPGLVYDAWEYKTHLA